MMPDQRLFRDALISAVLVLMIAGGLIWSLAVILTPPSPLEQCAQRLYDLPESARARVLGSRSALHYGACEQWCREEGVRHDR